MTERKLVVAAAIVDDLTLPTRLLAARRSKPEHLVGFWAFPGGKAELGETPLQALNRELGEELGIVGEFGDEIVGPNDGGWHITERHIMRLWLTTVKSGVPDPLIEHDLLIWEPIETLNRFNWLPGDVPIVAQIQALFAVKQDSMKQKFGA